MTFATLVHAIAHALGMAFAMFWEILWASAIRRIGCGRLLRAGRSCPAVTTRLPGVRPSSSWTESPTTAPSFTKLCGVEPNRYLLRATRAALADHAAVTLPHTLLA